MTLGNGRKHQPMVQFRGIMKRFGSVVAVEKIDFDIEEGSLVTLLGPSGCGKTTLLRMVAGLEAPTEGDIFIKGVRINDVPIHKRNLGMIFQNYALFPHLTVAQNVAFGLEADERIEGKRHAEQGPEPWRRGAAGDELRQPLRQRDQVVDARRHDQQRNDDVARNSVGQGDKCRPRISCSFAQPAQSPHTESPVRLVLLTLGLEVEPIGIEQKSVGVAVDADGISGHQQLDYPTGIGSQQDDVAQNQESINPTTLVQISQDGLQSVAVAVNIG